MQKEETEQREKGKRKKMEGTHRERLSEKETEREKERREEERREEREGKREEVTSGRPPPSLAPLPPRTPTLSKVEETKGSEVEEAGRGKRGNGRERGGGEEGKGDTERESY